MTILRAYLIGYYLLVGAAVIALWEAGVLAEIPLLWTVLAIAAAILSGVLLAVTSSTPRMPVD
jgi:hypothetical protein